MKYYKNKDDLEKGLEDLARHEFGWHPDNGKGKSDPWWNKGKYKPPKNSVSTRILKCPFRLSCECTFELLISTHEKTFPGTEQQKYGIQTKHHSEEMAHMPHNQNANGASLPMFAKLVMGSKKFLLVRTPTQQNNFFRQEMTTVNNSEKTGIAVDQRMEDAIRRYNTSKRKSWGVQSQSDAAKEGRTYGGLFKVVQKYNKIPVDQHETYCLGSWIDSKYDYVVAIFSTENLVLNGYRMFCEPGLQACVEIDCTYRLMHEGYALAILGTVSIDQIFHPIAYAVVNKENTAVFQFILRKVKHEIEKLVAERREKI